MKRVKFLKKLKEKLPRLFFGYFIQTKLSFQKAMKHLDKSCLFFESSRTRFILKEESITDTDIFLIFIILLKHIIFKIK